MHQTTDPTTVSARTPAGPLLSTRFAVPSPARDLVVRDRLLDGVSAGVEGLLTLVSAPAGSGKTVLLAAWLASRAVPGPVLWMTMDDGDERPGVFWAYVIEGLARTGVDLAGAGAPERPDTVARPLLDRLAVRIAARTEPVVLVLDDGDCLVDRTLGGDLGYLLRHCDGRLRVVLATRTDPTLPLHRYRLEGAVTEIRATDLAFTLDETSELLHRSGLDLAAPEVEALVDRTDGWPAGLKFAAMSLAGRADTGLAIREFTGDDGDVAAYLVSEVLDAQPSPLRDVLLRTSVVDQLEPGLLEALTGDPAGGRTLEFMAHGNSFIQPVSGHHGFYRYQPLFREFLRAQLRFERPDLVPGLHGLAADWFARNDRRPEAVGHAAAAGLWSDAARYLVDDLGIDALLTGPTDAPVAALFAALPDDAEGAEVDLVRAALAITAGEVDRCRASLVRVRAALDATRTRPAYACRLSVALIEARLGHRTSDVTAGLEAIDTAEHLLRSVVPPTVAARSAIGALLAGSRGELLLLRGDLGSARTSLAVAVDTADAAGREDLLADALGAGSLVAALSGRLRQATELAERADSIARRSGSTAGAGNTAAARAWIRMEEYALDATRDHAMDVEVAVSPDEPILVGVLALVRARLLRATGDLAGARAALLAVPDASSGAAPPAWLAAWLGAADAALLVADGHPDAAVDAIAELAEPELPEPAVILELARIAQGEVDSARAPVALAALAQDETKPLDTRVTALIVQATRAACLGDPGRARAALERSLRLASPELLRRPFKEASPAVRRMLRTTGHLAAQYPWLDVPPGIGPRSDETARPDPSGAAARVVDLIEPLTRKEQEVLGHLADLLGTDEIASAMFVSVNTVRTHVRSILRKLGAARRNEAIRRAWELGLLPGHAGGTPPDHPTQSDRPKPLDRAVHSKIAR
ncbi:helix-turn-helix transcriptional regulator [Pengzhenrongella frigida]|uniref:HTH luxR-type domain-containing protein n=1 Tax=Pengzhenrongella frigida TaxID=1259133 RepID=A0A4Q5N5D6_9MICO|nr:LuxR C-terminal-related transcriptional regulator [Cellulomonas sp. HLT2-17]RYV52713.1 hypothetical protein EUA98_01865 [Cellulomonas sp. HLT2-17]